MGDPERTSPFSSLAAEHSREGLALTGNGRGPENGTNSGSGSGPTPGRVRVVNRGFVCVCGGGVVTYCVLSVCVKVAQLGLTPCDPMDYIVHGILQARILEWVAFPFSRGSSQPRD